MDMQNPVIYPEMLKCSIANDDAKIQVHILRYYLYTFGNFFRSPRKWSSSHSLSQPNENESWKALLEAIRTGKFSIN